MSIYELRREYTRAALTEEDVADDPLRQFKAWYEQAVSAELKDANAMTLATASRDGRPSGRIVLLRGVSDRGFVFFTDYESRKGRELAENPNAALVFYWAELERQVCITGRAERLPREESEAYFRGRPRASQLAAWASRQSRVIPSREALEERLEDVKEKYEDRDVPTPPYWGGYRLVPDWIEFWQGRGGRLHDRLRYRRDDTGEWRLDRLSP